MTRNTISLDDHMIDATGDAGGDGDGRIQLPHLPARLLLAALLVSLLMVPVGLMLAALGVWVLEFSGGAADDTSIVVAIAGYLVADFWGGGLVAALTKARAFPIALAWGIARIVGLVAIALVSTKMAPFIPVQLALAVPVAWAGARTSRKQAALRRHMMAEAAARDRAG
ncbi:MAG: hypothetical protein JWO69_995 [Thermoleophilia bacterium]|nr:hypothetical protein [Thermoleophilia bacterium]